MANALLCFVVAFATLTMTAHAAQTNFKSSGETSASFLDVPVSVRQSALGGDQTALRGGVDAAFANPAAASDITIPQLWVGHNESYLSTKYDSVAFGTPFKNNSVWFSGRYISEGSTERTGVDTSNQPLLNQGNFSWSTLIGSIGAGHRFNSMTSVGAVVKGWRESGDKSSSTGWAADVGVQVEDWHPGLSLAAAVKNVGPSYQSYELPRTFTAGFGFVPVRIALLRSWRLLSELDYEKQRGTDVRTGLEFHQRYFSLRVGYQTLSAGSEFLDRMSFGAGVTLKGWYLDYAWVPQSFLGDEHRVAVSIAFGMSEEERKAQAQMLDVAMNERMLTQAQAHYGLGKAAAQQGNWTTAVDEYTAALTWDPNHQQARDALSGAQEQKRFLEAANYHDAAQKLALKGQWLDAASLWRRALELRPSFAEAKKGLENANNKMNRTSSGSRFSAAFDEGVRRYVKGDYAGALKIWGTIPSDYEDAAKVDEYMQRAKNKKLEEELERLKKESSRPEEATRLLQKGYDLYQTGQLDKAIQLWEQAVVLDPQNNEARVALQNGRQRQALNVQKDFQNIRAAELNSQALKEYSDGNLEQAIKLWRDALKIDPNNVRILNNVNRATSDLKLRGQKP